MNSLIQSYNLMFSFHANSIVVFIFYKRNKGDLTPKTIGVTMSGLTVDLGVDNPMATPTEHYGYDGDKQDLINNMN